MNEIANVFNYGGYDVRTVVIDGEPWFVAKDVCEILDTDPTATRKLDADEKGLHSIQTLGGTQQVSIVNESGLYSLVLSSRKAEAKAFKRWVTSEVLPAIRKTGRYVPEEKDPKLYLAQAVLIANKMIAEQDQIISEQKHLIGTLTPRAEVLDSILATDDLISIDGMAKLLGYEPQGFYKWIRYMKYVRNDKMTHQHMLDRGYMKYKMNPWENGLYSGVSVTPYFTPAAIEKLRKYAEEYMRSVSSDCCMLKRTSGGKGKKCNHEYMEAA